MSESAPKKRGPARKVPAALRTDWITDRAGLAHVLGLAELNSISKLVARGMPRQDRGRYDLAACVPWYIQDVKSRGQVDPDEIEEVVLARTKLYDAQRLGKEIDNAIRTKQVAYIEQMDAGAMDLGAEFNAGLEQLPGRAAVECVRAQNETEAREILTRHANEIRERVSERLAAVARDLRAGGGPDPTPT